MLRANENLIVLGLGRFNHLTTETIRFFSTVIEYNNTIEHLPLEGSRSISEDTTAVERIVRVLVRNRNARQRKVAAKENLFSSFLRNKDSKGSWNRSKLMILGQPGSGKT